MIELSNVTKAYTETAVPIKDFSLNVNEGETVILSGPSGCGKSTVLSLIAALIRPTSGDITVDGRKIAKLPENFAALYRREHIGIIFQNYNLISHMTAIENVAVPLMPTNLRMTEIKSRAAKLLETLKIADKADVSVTKLSGGEQQRVAIARALINNPKIILADEPTANLDQNLTDSLIEIFRDFSAGGLTLVIATHDRAVTESGLASRIIEMKK